VDPVIKATLWWETPGLSEEISKLLQQQGQNVLHDADGKAWHWSGGNIVPLDPMVMALECRGLTLEIPENQS
jgi:hypothetical protein